ncbi:MAG: hypothetical protein IJD89_00830 [Clostridia bacterium]|nr:hypothetical protein [Clostridia bacterium]
MKKAREVAFLGIITALSVVSLFIGTIIGVLDITAAVLASLLVLVAFEELRWKSILVYFATIIISFCFAFFASPLPAAEYAIFALYPLIKPLFDKLPNVIGYILKGVYTVVASLVTVVVMYLLVPSAAEKPYMLAIYVAMFIVTVILFEMLIVRFRRYYRFKLRGQLRIDKFFK